MALNFYPGVESSTSGPQKTPGLKEGGLGNHTDLQCFTILYQDHVGGLLVLNGEGQWIEASPVEDTLVVNIGDFI